MFSCDENIKCQSLISIFRIAVLRAFKFFFYFIFHKTSFIFLKNVSFYKYFHKFLLFQSKILGRVDHDPPHLPHGHLAIVGVRVVVPLDGRQVGVEVEEGGGWETLLQASLCGQVKVVLIMKFTQFIDSIMLMIVWLWMYLRFSPQTRRDSHITQFIMHLPPFCDDVDFVILSSSAGKDWF